MRAASLVRRAVAALLLSLLTPLAGFADEPVDFERHIMGLFGRMGCNGGSCHGSFQGKGGFRLSLFGYEPQIDYYNLTRDSQGRRINRADPDQSLVLLKATGQVKHEGGVRFGKNSEQYKALREWIVQGAPWTRGSGDVQKIDITPLEAAFAKAGPSVTLKVQATFKDGSQADITPYCDFRTNDDAVADVTNQGTITALQAGSTAVIVSYRGNVLPVRVLVPAELRAGFVYPKVPENNYLDTFVFSRLKQLNMVPSDLAGDAEFLRRLTIDTIGCLPAPEDVRAYLNSKDPNKREKKIDELLRHPLHAALWATKLSDITGNNTVALEQPQNLKAKRSQQWHDWFKKRIQENVPYDQIVRDVLCATSREGKDTTQWLQETKAIDLALVKGFDSTYADRKTLDLFWRKQQNVPIEQLGEKTAAAFMGVRLECAQCHKHPFDRWTQEEYRAYANIFGQVAFSTSPEAKSLIDAENAERKKNLEKGQQLAVLKEVWIGGPVKALNNPDSKKPLLPRALGGPVISVAKGEDARVQLFDWLRRPDNPFFARSFVNRIWGHYFGIGIVHPVDDFSLGNPPSNDKLLNALAKDFIDSGYDIRTIEKRVLMSRTYQLSSVPNATNKLDRNNFARSYIRPMMAEVVVDVINSALGVEEKFGPEIRPGSRAIEVGASQIAQAAGATYAFRIFGRSARTAACDCERALEPALPQKLYTMTDPTILAKLKEPQSRLTKLLKSTKSEAEIVEELFLATLSRLPTAEDRDVYNLGRQRARTRDAALTDTLWALINTREFILNH